MCNSIQLRNHFLLQCIASYETKGGPIQTVRVDDVTKLSASDLVVADSRGIVTIFCNEQILTRKVVSEHCIHCLQVDRDTSEFIIAPVVIPIVL